MDENDPFLVLPDPYLRAIGLVCVEWTGMERLLNLLVMKLLGMSERDPRAMIVTEHIAYPLKLDIFKSLIHELQEGYPHLSAVPSLYGRLGGGTGPPESSDSRHMDLRYRQQRCSIRTRCRSWTAENKHGADHISGN